MVGASFLLPQVKLKSNTSSSFDPNNLSLKSGVQNAIYRLVAPVGSHHVAMKLGDHLKMGVTVSRSKAERIVHSAGVDTVLGKKQRPCSTVCQVHLMSHVEFVLNRLLIFVVCICLQICSIIFGSHWKRVGESVFGDCRRHEHIGILC